MGFGIPPSLSHKSETRSASYVSSSIFSFSYICSHETVRCGSSRAMPRLCGLQCYMDSSAIATQRSIYPAVTVAKASSLSKEQTHIQKHQSPRPLVPLHLIAPRLTSPLGNNLEYCRDLPTMTHFLFHTFLLYFLILANDILTLGHVIARDSELDASTLPERRLRAAKRNHDLGARDVKGCLRYDHNLHYLDGK